MNRRDFVRSSAAFAALAPLGLHAAQPRKRSHKKALMFQTFNSATARKLSVKEKFQMARDAGFEGIEVASAMDQAEVLAARDAAGVAIPSVVISTHWAKPLTSNAPADRQVGFDGLLQGLRDAKAYGAKSVLLVPGVVNKDVSYATAYARSTVEIKKAIPLAEQLGVAIAIENVWNAFLMSPLEAAAYVDAFKSPLVRWHFDVGNVINTGWPHHWIEALGPRIAAVHVKEYSRKLRDEKGPRAGFAVELTKGDSDWPAVMAALDAANYTGWLIAEQWRPAELSDAEWLKNLTTRMDEILAL